MLYYLVCRLENRIEGDNARMKCFCGAANPNIDKAVGLLITYDEASARDKYENAKKKTTLEHLKEIQM